MKKNDKKKTTKKNNISKKDIIIERAKKFFNDPKPIIIFLIAIICFLLIFISKSYTKNSIYVGEVNENEIQIANIHYFTNNDMNYFYASNALFMGPLAEKEVYSYQIGYFVEDSNGQKHEFASRSKKADTPATLTEIVEELSGWSFAESSVNTYFFTKDVINNFANLHFIIKASTNKDSEEADISLDYIVDLNKITK